MWRMDADQHPHQMLVSLMHDADAAPGGGAPNTICEKCHKKCHAFLKNLQVSTCIILSVCELCGSLRCMLYKLT
jgi:hypothetical protein